jgi:hypothetical protein
LVLLTFEINIFLPSLFQPKKGVFDQKGVTQGGFDQQRWGFDEE